MLLQSVQKIVLDEGVGITGQVIPVTFIYTGDVVGENNFHRYGDRDGPEDCP
jgi:hypothetical protein